MAFTSRTKSGVCVKQGNTGKTLSCFRGKNAQSRANARVAQLHRTHKPKASNRGASARRKNR